MRNFRIYNRLSGADFGVFAARDEQAALEILAQEGGGVVTRRDDSAVEWHRRVDPNDWLIEPVE
jgi:hypothetical protein